MLEKRYEFFFGGGDYSIKKILLQDIFPGVPVIIS